MKVFWITTMLLLNTWVGVFTLRLRQWSVCQSAWISSMAVCMVMSSASWVEDKMAPCHLLIQLMGVWPMKRRVLVMDLCVHLSWAWSQLKKAEVSQGAPWALGALQSMSSVWALHLLWKSALNSLRSQMHRGPTASGTLSELH